MNILQFLLILKAHTKLMLLTLTLSVVLVSVISLQLPKAYTATASLVVNVRGADPVTGQAMQSQQIAGYLATQVDVIRSPSVALKVVDDLKLAQEAAFQQQFQRDVQAQISIRDWLAATLLRNLDVKPSGGSSVLYVTYKSADPQLAARLANAFVQAYIQTNLELKTQPAKQTAVWYNQQLAVLRSNLEKSQEKLSSHQQSKGIVSLDEKLDIESTRLAELSSQMVAAQGQTYDSLSIQNNASSASASVMDNPVIQGLKGELARSEAKFSQLAQRVGNNHPEYLRAEAEVNSLRGKLASETNTAQQSINTNLSVSRQREGELRAALAAQKAKVLALNANRDAGSVFAREVESAQRIYDQALERFSQTQLEGHAGQTEISVLSSAVVPLVPSTPNVRLNVALSIIFGTLLGVGLALIREMLNRRVRSIYDVIAVLDIPVLGVLTAGKKSRRLSRGRRKLPGLNAPMLSLQEEPKI
ncbi:MAG: chain length determinant protein EpsF [Thiobacillus sp.]|nr:chain length determinant protein EpsF [Thiobacillus sp.]MDO9385089.1 chain length determinant protein EpsF [Thiobacillus sp.]